MGGLGSVSICLVCGPVRLSSRVVRWRVVGLIGARVRYPASVAVDPHNGYGLFAIRYCS